MELHFEPVTAQNRDAALGLHVADNQKTFIETTEQCLTEASQYDGWRPVCIYDGTLPVGFAMYGFFNEYRPEGRLWLDRIFIDERYQGRGYGTAALTGLIERLEREYGLDEIYLSIVEENRTAAELYQKFGFRFNGETDIHGEMVMVRKKRAVAQ